MQRHSDPHPEDLEPVANAQRHLLQLQLYLDEGSRRFEELNKNLKDKEEEVTNQAKTIEELRTELTQAKEELVKEKSKNVWLRDKLKEEKQGRRLELEDRICKFERDVSLAMKNFLGGGSGGQEGGEGGVSAFFSTMVEEPNNNSAVWETGSASSSTSVTMPILTSAIQPGYDEPQLPGRPQQNLKRKLGDEEAGNGLTLKRTPPRDNQRKIMPKICFLCEMPALIVGKLLAHVQSAHPNVVAGDKLACPFNGCAQKFDRVNVFMMNNHYKAHVAVTDFECPHTNCKMHFKMRHGLERHYIRKQRERLPPSMGDEAVQNTELVTIFK